MKCLFPIAIPLYSSPSMPHNVTWTKRLSIDKDGKRKIYKLRSGRKDKGSTSSISFTSCGGEKAAHAKAKEWLKKERAKYDKFHAG